jgi:hypothetical protein
MQGNPQEKHINPIFMKEVATIFFTLRNQCGEGVSSSDSSWSASAYLSHEAVMDQWVLPL